MVHGREMEIRLAACVVGIRPEEIESAEKSINNGRLAAVWQLFTVTTHSHVRKSPFLGD
jgi:hypothetical protein